MKAVLQNFRNGVLKVTDVPPPTLKAGGILVANAASLVSAGTEKAVLELAKMGPIGKAKTRPDLVKKVLNRAGQEGLLGTAQIVMNLVSNPLPLGYSSAGIVREVGSNVTGFQPGVRVACAGLGYANHAEVIYVPRNLAVAIPDGVDFEDAAFVTMGAIAMQGVRQGEVQLGQEVVVLGLGLLGQLTAQICRAAGCRVFGVDLDSSKVSLAKSLGMEAGSAASGKELVSEIMHFTRNRGADVILITASTSSNQPVELAAMVARDRAKVVAVGDVGLNIPRRPYFEKEIEFRLSRSYGPGRYDASYEERGIDYPIGYVRWTENRNMESFLDLVNEKKVQVKPLITHRHPIENAEVAYQLLSPESKEPYLGIILGYDLAKTQTSKVSVHEAPGKNKTQAGNIRFGVIGAGQFAQGILMPKLKNIAKASIDAVATGSGLTSKRAAEKFGARFCTSDYREILADKDIDAVLIATRHDMHSKMASEALANGKHVFVEKPLATNAEELNSLNGVLESAKEEGAPLLMVGFNRRFSPLAIELKKRITGRPLAMHYRVNAGPVPKDSWVQDPASGGGRIVGEVCHFVDLMQFLTDSEPVEVFSLALNPETANQSDPDNVSVQIRFSDGSMGTVLYVANGDPSFPKERLEVFGGGAVGVIDNWRRLEVRSQGKKYVKKSLLFAEKGHHEELKAFVEGVRKGIAPISLKSLFLTTKATFAIGESLRNGKPVLLDSIGDLT